MKLKTILFLSLFLKCLTSFGQFKQPELTIIRPEIILPESQLNCYAKPKKLKKRILDRTTTEYDRNGNIIKEIITDDTSVETNIYNYKNNVLVEKNGSTITDSKKVKNINANTISSTISDDGTTVIALLNDASLTTNYKAELDKNNRVISSTYQYNENRGYNPIHFILKTNVIYENGKIVEINNSNNEKEYYFYNKNRLVKKENIKEKYGNSKISGIEYFLYEIEEYLYDTKNNLITIKYNSKNTLKGKVIEQSNYTKDSAVYNNKNKLIWVGQKISFMTYKYDNNNNIIERCQFNHGKEKSKDEYFYKNNQLIKVINTDNYEPDNRNFVVTTNYSYNEGKLTNCKKTNSTLSLDQECIYEYDEAGCLKKITENNAYYNKKTAEAKRIDTTVTNYNFNKNTLTIRSKYGGLKEYEFYE